MSDDNGNNQNNSINATEHINTDIEQSKKEVAQTESSSRNNVNHTIRESEQSAAIAKQHSAKHLKADEAQKEQLANADQMLKDKYSKQAISQELREEALALQEAQRIKTSSEEERRIKNLGENRQALNKQHNQLSSIKNGSKGGSFAIRPMTRSPRPLHHLPNTIRDKYNNYVSGKTLISAVISKEVGGTYLRGSQVYIDDKKIENGFKNEFHKHRDKYLTEGMSTVEADAKAGQDAQAWKNRQTKKGKTVSVGGDAAQKSRDHKLRVEEEARAATQKYLNELNNRNILINYMLDQKYKVYELDENGKVINPDNPILTNDAPKYADKAKFKLVQNFEIKTYGEMSWEERVAISKAVAPIAQAEYEEAFQNKASEHNVELKKFLTIQKKKFKWNPLNNVRLKNGTNVIKRYKADNEKAFSKKMNELVEVKGELLITQQEIEDLNYLLEFANNPSNPDIDKQKAKKISESFNNIRKISLIKELIKEKEELVEKLVRSESFKHSDLLKILNIEDLEQAKVVITKHFNIENINKLDDIELYQKLLEYRNIQIDKGENLISDILQETTDGQEQDMSFKSLKANELLGKYYSEVTEEEIKEYKNSNEYQDYIAIQLPKIKAYEKKRAALFARFPDKKFTEEEIEKKKIINTTGLTESDLHNEGFIATHILLNRYSPLKGKSLSTAKKDLGAIFSYSQKINKAGYGVDGFTGKKNAAHLSGDLKTHFDGIFSLPTGSTILKLVDPADLESAFKYLKDSIYEPYDLFDVNLHLDELAAGAHIHWEMSLRNRYTKKYDVREHKTKLVNDFFGQDYVHRQSIRNDFISTLDNRLREFLSVANSYPDEIHAEDLSPFIQAAFEEFIEENDVTAFRFGKVRPEIQNKVITLFNANVIENQKQRAEGKPEIPLDLVFLTKRIRQYVLEEYDRKPIYFLGEHRTKIEQQVFGYHWNDLTSHIVAKEFFGTPEMKNKYGGLEFAMSDIAEEKQNIVTKNYHRQKGYYTDGITADYLDMPNDEFIKLVQHNVAKSINPYQAAIQQEEKELIHEQKMDKLNQENKALERRLKLIEIEAEKQRLREHKQLEDILEQQDNADEDIRIAAKQKKEIADTIYELSKTPEAKIQKTMLSEFTMSSLLVSKLDEHQMFLILDNYKKLEAEEQKKYKQAVINHKYNLKQLITDGGNVDHSPNIVFAEYVLNVEPIVEDLVHACHLMSTGKVNNYFDPESHLTEQGYEAYEILKTNVGDKVGHISFERYLPFIADLINGLGKENVLSDFRQYIVKLNDNNDYEFVKSESTYIDKSEFEEEPKEQPVHEVTKHLVKKRKLT